MTRRRAGLLCALLCGSAACGEDDTRADPPVEPSPPPPPQIVAVTPPSVPFRSGGQVEIAGRGFQAPLTLLLDGEPVEPELVNSEGVTFTAAPRSHGGRVEIRIEAAGGVARWSEFRYRGIDPNALLLVRESLGLDAVFERALSLGEAAPLLLWAPGRWALAELDADGLRLAWSFEGELVPATLEAACAGHFEGDASLWTSPGGFWRRAAGGALELVEPVDAPRPGHARCAVLDGSASAQVLVTATSDEGVPVLLSLAPGAAPRELLRLDRPATGLDLADVDDDGDLDLAVGRDGAAPRLLLGDGAGAFTDAPVGALPATPSTAEGAPHFADLDGDGAVDLLVAGNASTAVWLGDGAGRFVDLTPRLLGSAMLLGVTPTVVDVDVDGAADLLLLEDGSATLLRNDGEGRLYDYTATALRPAEATGRLRQLLPLDADSDGDPDFLALAEDMPPLLLRNWSPAPLQESDADGDRIPAAVDNCPAVDNVLQRNRDRWPFACSPDGDCAAGCQLHRPASGPPLLDCRGRPLNQAQARTFCATRGARLLHLADAEEQLALAEELEGRIWLDLGDAAEEGRFVDSQGRPPSFEAWNEGEPNDATGGEDCVELLLPEARWNDVRCTSARAFICELSESDAADADAGDACDACPLTPGTPATPVRASYACPADAECENPEPCTRQPRDAGVDVLDCRELPLTQPEASAYCALRGARLLWPDTRAELDALAAWPGRYWIDLQDHPTEGAFYASTGERLSFDAWGVDQPDDAGEGEDCVELLAPEDGAPVVLNDVGCDQPRAFFCEVNPCLDD